MFEVEPMNSFFSLPYTASFVKFGSGGRPNQNLTKAPLVFFLRASVVSLNQ